MQKHDLIVLFLMLSTPFYLGAQLADAGHTEAPPLPPDLLAKNLLIDSLHFPFIDFSHNRLHQSEALSSFFERLQQLEADSLQQVRIVHIGDSHLQADFFTGLFRAMLQDSFGSAGRGLVFPYPLAKSHSPYDLYFSSTASWQGRRSIYRKEGPPLGVCGISVRSYTPQPELSVSLRDRYHYGRDYAFDRISVFHEEGASFFPFYPDQYKETEEELLSPAKPQARYHKVRSGDTLYDLARAYKCSVNQLKSWNNLSGSRINIGQQLIVENGATPRQVRKNLALPTEVIDSQHTAFLSSYTLEQPTRELTLINKDTNKGAATLYGLVLENTQSRGILYHVIGVNGVTYQHYNHSEHFWEQLPELQPDLIVVSLGTNEALAPGFQEVDFQRQVTVFVKNVRKFLPETPLLLSTNPDVLRRRRYENPNNLKVRQTLIDAAAHYDLALWDLYKVMGDDGSIREWRKAELAHTDYVHFTKEGYWVQAHLFFQALMNAYYASN